AGGPWSTQEDCEASCGTTSGPSTTTTTTAGPTTTSTTYACTGTRSYECMEGFEGEDTVYNWSELGGATCNGAPCFSEDGPAACCGPSNVGAVEVIPCRNDQDCGRAGCVWR